MSNKNMFALLNDGSDDEDNEAPKAAPAKKETKADAPSGKPQGDKPRNERKPRNRDDRPARESYESSDKVPGERGGKGNRRDYGDRPERSGKGKGKGSRGDSGREYPRRSGTGRGRENPRQGGGKYNWGKDTDGANTTGSEEAATEGAEPSAERAEAPAAEERVVEEEDNSMSYDDYLKAQAAKAAELNGLNKAGDTPSVSDREADVKMAENDKVEEAVEDEYACMFHGGNKKKKDHGRKQARDGFKQADQVLNLKFVDEDAGASSGKGKGGKGDRRQGGKGDRPRQGGKGDRNDRNSSQKPQVDINSQDSFPTLGGKAA